MFINYAFIISIKLYAIFISILKENMHYLIYIQFYFMGIVQIML